MVSVEPCHEGRLGQKMGVDQRIFDKGHCMSAQAPRPRVGLGLLIAISGFVPVIVNAATTPDKSVTYRWVDEAGVVHYGDRIPPQYAQKEQAVLNSQGVEVRRLGAQKSSEQIAAEDRVQQGIIRQKQHDSFLMTTYTSVKDIEALRDVRLDQMRVQRVSAEQYVENLRSRLGSVQTRARIFKPYSDKPGARRMPDQVAEDLIRTLNELHTQNEVLVTKGHEEAALKAQFQSDIERYRELRAAHTQQ
jgi:hypothetical protein